MSERAKGKTSGTIAELHLFAQTMARKLSPKRQCFDVGNQTSEG
jgi:hypothetical protein